MLVLADLIIALSLSALAVLPSHNLSLSDGRTTLQTLHIGPPPSS